MCSHILKKWYLSIIGKKKKFKDIKLMERPPPPALPDINPIKNVWLIIKKDLHKNEKQYSRKDFRKAQNFCK